MGETFMVFTTRLAIAAVLTASAGQAATFSGSSSVVAFAGSFSIDVPTLEGQFGIVVSGFDGAPPSFTAQVDEFAEDVDGFFDPIARLRASGDAYSVSGDTLTLLLDVSLDTPDMFGPQVEVEVTFSEFDMTGATIPFFVSDLFDGSLDGVNADIVIRDAPVGVIPLPAAFPMLAGAIGLIGWAGWRRAA
jgi:hypothetical protein